MVSIFLIFNILTAGPSYLYNFMAFLLLSLSSYSYVASSQTLLWPNMDHVTLYSDSNDFPSHSEWEWKSPLTSTWLRMIWLLLPPWYHSLVLSLSSTLLLSHWSPCCVVTMPNIPASGPLHLQFLLLEASSSGYPHGCSLTSFRSLLQHHLIREIFLASLYKSSNSLSCWNNGTIVLHRTTHFICLFSPEVESENFYKRPHSKYFSFIGHVVFIATKQLCQCSRKEATDNT